MHDRYTVHRKTNYFIIIEENIVKIRKHALNVKMVFVRVDGSLYLELMVVCIWQLGKFIPGITGRLLYLELLRVCTWN